MVIKKTRVPPFVMLRKDLLKDPCWRSLTNSAKVLYIYLRNKYNHKTLDNVSLTYSEIKDLFSRQTITNGFRELEDNGFIKKTKHGGLFGGVCRYTFTGPYKDFL